MADNVIAPAVGATFATDEIAGVHYPISKLAFGALESLTRVTASSGLPVQQQTGAAWVIQGVQDTATASTITSATSVVGPLSVVQRNVITVSVSGTYAGVTFVVEVSDDGGTSWFPLQCIDNETGRAGATWTPATNATMSLDSAVGGYTHLRVRATAWTSGTANVRLTAQSFAYDPVVAAITQCMDADAVMAAVGVANGDLFSIDTRGIRTIFLQLTGTFAGTCTFQGSNDGTTWSTVNAINASSGAVATTATAVGIFAIPVRTRYVRARVTTYTSGSWNGVYRMSSLPLDTAGVTQTVSASGTVTANQGTLAAPSGTPINSAATTNATSVKASAGTLYSVTASNTGASAAYVKFYNLAVAPTVGTSTPVITIPVPAGGTVNLPFGTTGFRFTTGIALAITGAAADADTTAVAAAQVKVLPAYI